jgi:glycosyltransferase involved in cell wall biosynthesis
VTLWTGWLSPEMEGCSKEVFALKDHFPRSRVFGLSQYYGVRLSRRNRYVGLNVRLYALFRAVAPVYEATSQINHIYGGLGEWHFLRALGRRPIVMTAAVDQALLDRDLYRHVRRFVVHAPATARHLVERGFGADRIRVIYPGVDLRRNRPQPRALAPRGAWPTARADCFRVLFATTPNTVEGLKARGVDLILEAARRLPDVEFFLPWRPWAGAGRLVAVCKKEAPPNVHVSEALVRDMRQVLQAADATVAPFTTVAGMKVCPTSLIESLACGRPLLLSTKVGISDLVRDEGCGEVFEPSADGLCQAILALRANHLERASNARRTAERHFDLDGCLVQHECLYEELLRSSC